MNMFSLYLKVQFVRVKTLIAYKKSWRQIPIKENKEPLVLVPEDVTHPFYAIDMKMTSNKCVYLRKSVLDKFLLARKMLMNVGYDLKIYDGWRPNRLQESLFWYYMKEFIIPKFPQIKKCFDQAVSPQNIKEVFYQLPLNVQETLREANKTYVSWPSVSLESPSPHTTGGAIDVWLYKNEKPATLGIPFDWMEESSGAFYHLKIKRKKFLGDKQVCLNRNMLIYAMVKSGFSCYGPEIWHFNYGNQMHSLVTGEKAIYSYVEP